MKFKIRLFQYIFILSSINLTYQIKSNQIFYDKVSSNQLSSLCQCAMNFPPCCSKELETYVCLCAPRPICDSCPSSIASIHDSMMRMAMKDAYAQQEMANKAKMQLELFQKAQDYAKEIGIQELKAKQYANEVNEYTKKAQYARSMMFQTATQIKMLSEKTAKMISPLGAITKVIASPTPVPLMSGVSKVEKRMILSDKGTMIVQGKPNN